MHVSQRDLSSFEELRQQFITGVGQQVSRVPYHDPAATPIWRALRDNPHPRVKKAGAFPSTDTHGIMGEGIGFFGDHRMPALAPSIRTIEIADWFAEPDHMIVEMGSYRRLQLLKLRAEEKIYGYVKGWSPPKEKFAPSPFGPPEHRFHKFDPTPHFEQSHGFIHFIGR